MARPDDALAHMLDARAVALVGASARPGSFGERALLELERSPSLPAIHLVNPRYAGQRIGGHTVVASLDDVGEPLDLVLLAVGDRQLEPVLTTAARRGDRSAVIFGNAVDPRSPRDSAAFRARLAEIATGAGMAVCGGGCMGFVSPGLRALGYLERSPLPAGPIALVTHSGSAFSALLRTDRPFGWSLAVSSGQELVTTAAEYLEYALSLPETGVVALLLETLRAPDRLRAALSRAAEGGVPVVALVVGTSEAGRAMVTAHSGALAGSDGAWEALFDACGVLRVGDLPEMCDTLELLVAGRRAPSRRLAAADRPGDHDRGVAAVLDSGAERALTADVAAGIGLRFAAIGPVTAKRIAQVLDPGLKPSNPLDVWGRGASTEELFTTCLSALAEDEAVDAVALAVDLVPEFDGDESYRAAVAAAWAASDVPMCVLSHTPSALDREAAGRLRRRGIPVLEGTRSGLLALRHLLELRDFTDRSPVSAPPLYAARRDRWLGRLAAGPLGPLDGFHLLADYGIASPPAIAVASTGEAAAAAQRLGCPVVLKTAEPGIDHKSDAGGVVLGLGSADEVADAYDRLARRLGPQALVAATAPPGVELALGIVRDPSLGPLVVAGAGGVLVELLADRSVALPPLDHRAALRLLDRLRVRRLLDGYRDVPAADLRSVSSAMVGVATLAAELGGAVAALDVNPLSCGPTGALALDVLVEVQQPRIGEPERVAGRRDLDGSRH